ncbi:MAG: glycosyltransferase family 4 protein [Candidatus Methanoperedens sp.]|nr:glycosyltransferase family 4 protein [Candidatus Methanoperedens sp.]
MKIAIINQPIGQMFPPSSRGSIEIITYEFARRLAGSHNVIVYSPGPGIRKKEKWEDKIEYLQIPTYFDRKFLLKFISPFSKLRPVKQPMFLSRLYYLGYILQVANDLRKQRCDIVHIYNFSQFIPVIRALNPGLKIVLHMECDWMAQLDKSVIGKRLSKANLVLGCSDFITENIRCRFPQFASRCQTVYNGADINNFPAKYDKNPTKNNDIKKLLFVGRISPEKGVHVLLEALKTVVEKFPEIQLDAVGPDAETPFEFIIRVEDDEKVSRLALFYDKSSGSSYFTQLRDKMPKDLANHINFPGNIAQSQLRAYYLNADIFVFPSVWDEPFGMPIIEAMACEIPVITTRGGGITEIVEDGKTGLLVERDDAGGLASAILKLISDDELREKMGKAGRQRVIEIFSWDRVVENLLHNYEKILDGHQI